MYTIHKIYHSTPRHMVQYFWIALQEIVVNISHTHWHCTVGQIQLFSIRHISVFYHSCDSKMTSETDREIHSHVVKAVEEAGLDIKSASFDAKSRDLAMRGASLQPLSVFELQRSISKEVKKITIKDDLREEIAAYIDVKDGEGCQDNVPALTVLCLRTIIGYQRKRPGVPDQPIAKRKGRKKTALTSERFTVLLTKIKIDPLRLSSHIS